MKTKKSATFAKKIENKYTNDKNYRDVKGNCHNTGKYSIHKEIPVVFIIKELAKKFVGEFNEVKGIDKYGEEITKTTSYKLQFIDSARFMASSLSNLADNLAEAIHKIKCKYRHDNKKCETCGIKNRDCECCLKYLNIKNDLIL